MRSLGSQEGPGTPGMWVLSSSGGMSMATMGHPVLDDPGLLLHVVSSQPGSMWLI